MDPEFWKIHPGGMASQKRRDPFDPLLTDFLTLVDYIIKTRSRIGLKKAEKAYDALKALAGQHGVSAFSMPRSELWWKRLAAAEKEYAALRNKKRS